MSTRSGRIFLFGVLTLIGLFECADAHAERIVIRGRRGPIIVNRGGFVPGQFARPVQPARRVSQNLISFNGQLFEQDRFGRIRPLFINRSTGQLLNAQEPDTARQLSEVFARNIDRMFGANRQLADRFLQGQGLDPFQRQDPFAGLAVPGVGPAERGPLPGDGKHGNGSGGVTDPAGRPGRSLAGGPQVGGNGKLNPSACRDLNGAICGGRDPRAEEQVVRGKARELINAFLSAQGLSFNQFAASMSNILRSPRAGVGPLSFGRCGGGGVCQGPGGSLPGGVGPRGPSVGQVFSGFMDFLQQRVPGIDTVVGSVKTNLLKAIDNFPFSDSARARMKQKIGNLTFRTSPPMDDPAAVEGFIEGCGPDGLSPGAFAVPETNDVVICPGMILRAVALGGEAQLEHHLLHVIGHECTHHVGADVFRDRNTGRVFGQSPFRPQFRQLLGCLSSRFRGVDPVAMGGEIAADVGAVRTMVERLRGASPEEAFNFIKAAVSPLCGSPNDGVHPSGSFRINVILGEDPDIAALLGCPVSSSACGLAGRISDTQ